MNHLNKSNNYNCAKCGKKLTMIGTDGTTFCTYPASRLVMYACHSCKIKTEIQEWDEIEIDPLKTVNDYKFYKTEVPCAISTSISEELSHSPKCDACIYKIKALVDYLEQRKDKMED